MAAGKNRREPVDVERVMHGGFRYEAPRLGQPFGYEQDSGFVTARDAATGALAGSQRVYVVDYSEDMEEDKQDVFIRALALTPRRQAPGDRQRARSALGTRSGRRRPDRQALNDAACRAGENGLRPHPGGRPFP